MFITETSKTIRNLLNYGEVERKYIREPYLVHVIAMLIEHDRSFAKVRVCVTAINERGEDVGDRLRDVDLNVMDTDSVRETIDETISQLLAQIVSG